MHNTVAIVIARVALLLALGARAWAQIPVQGRVVDPYGHPIEHAEVNLLADSAQRATVLSKAVSNTTGAFAIVAPSAGRFFLLVRRIGYVPARRVLDVSAAGSDSVLIHLGDYWTFRQVADSMARVQHWERVAVARRRPRRWVCGDSRQATREAANAAYARFAISAYSGLRQMLAEYAMPHRRDAFLREFTRELSPEECAAFAEGLDKRYGLEADTVRVFRFGKALFLPDWGDAGGAFADWRGELLTVFVVPS